MEKINENQFAELSVDNQSKLQSPSLKIAGTGGSVSVVAKVYIYDEFGDIVQTKTVTPALTGSAEGFSINGNTVTAAARTDSNTADRYISLTITHVENGQTMTINDFRVIQQANIPIVAGLRFWSHILLAESDGSNFNLTNTLSYVQLRHQDGSIEEKEVTGGVVFTTPHSEIQITNGTQINVPSLPAGSYGRSFTLKGTMTYNGVTISDTKTIYQGGRDATYVEIDGVTYNGQQGIWLTEGTHSFKVGKVGQPTYNTNSATVLSGDTVYSSMFNNFSVKAGKEASVVIFTGLPNGPQVQLQIAPKD